MLAILYLPKVKRSDNIIFEKAWREKRNKIAPNCISYRIFSALCGRNERRFLWYLFLSMFLSIICQFKWKQEMDFRESMGTLRYFPISTNLSTKEPHSDQFAYNIMILAEHSEELSNLATEDSKQVDRFPWAYIDGTTPWDLWSALYLNISIRARNADKSLDLWPGKTIRGADCVCFLLLGVEKMKARLTIKHITEIYWRFLELKYEIVEALQQRATGMKSSLFFPLSPYLRCGSLFWTDQWNKLRRIYGWFQTMNTKISCV